ncbi:hypothetical protein GYMLUDRAFT_45542 [Collybiopsis luxurians FD-317 M1]|uniref:CinA C-terminal domain-containing protein n=1 Tax=Collybiopsis luxurians FD-317 M1 TaxID=944289 RepID=A0A0D0BSJ3_9AGAR|nr:hypothetical protein GYMLUDRAFT_45542 [Collybiopsis luxurians FD-317 M1]
MSFLTPTLKLLASEIASLLILRNETLSIAETACGGLMSAAILSVPGTSKCFQGGMAAYSLESRITFLGWTKEDLENYRGPTEQIALNLALHLRSTLSSTWCLSESGICGPTRPDVWRKEIKGPGYCAYGLVGGRGVVGAEGKGDASVPLQTSKEIDVPQPKTREENMVAFAEEGLRFLLDTLKAQSVQ